MPRSSAHILYLHKCYYIGPTVEFRCYCESRVTRYGLCHMRIKTAGTFDKTILLIATLLLAFRQASIPNASFWQSHVVGHKYIALVFIAVSGIFGALTPFETLTRRSRAERSITQRRIILSTFGQLLEIGRSIQPPLDVSDMGLHIWKKRRTLRHPTGGELKRVSTYRLGSVPVTRSIRPAKGVGVVGLCWQRDREVGFNVAELVTQLPDKNAFESYVTRNGSEAVMGFSWEDLQRYRHRGAVFASPIRNGRSKFVGCISFDAERGYNELVSTRLWHQLNTLSVVLGEEGFDLV
jgi:hypothetical protein